MQELKRKIILKGKKIGYLEDSLNEHPDKIPEREDVIDEEGNEMEEESLRSEDKRKEKVCRHLPGWPAVYNKRRQPGSLFCTFHKVPQNHVT